MFLQEVEIVVGVKLDALPLRHVLRVGVDPLFSVLEKVAAVHELRLLGVLRDAFRLRASGWSGRHQSARRFGCALGDRSSSLLGVFKKILTSRVRDAIVAFLLIFESG